MIYFSSFSNINYFSEYFFFSRILYLFSLGVPPFSFNMRSIWSLFFILFSRRFYSIFRILFALYAVNSHVLGLIYFYIISFSVFPTSVSIAIVMLFPWRLWLFIIICIWWDSSFFYLFDCRVSSFFFIIWFLCMLFFLLWVYLWFILFYNRF